LADDAAARAATAEADALGVPVLEGRDVIAPGRGVGAAGTRVVVIGLVGSRGTVVGRPGSARPMTGGAIGRVAIGGGGGALGPTEGGRGAAGLGTRAPLGDDAALG